MQESAEKTKEVHGARYKTDTNSDADVQVTSNSQYKACKFN